MAINEHPSWFRQCHADKRCVPKNQIELGKDIQSVSSFGALKQVLNGYFGYSSDFLLTNVVGPCRVYNFLFKLH